MLREFGVRQAIIFILAALPCLLATSPVLSAEIDQGLRQLMAQKDADDMYPVLMVYDNSPELDAEILSDLEGLDSDKRRKIIIIALKKKAKKVQESAAGILIGPDPDIRVDNFQQLYFANALSFEGNQEAIELLGQLDVQATLYHDQTYDFASATRQNPTSSSVTAPAAVDTVWSVKYINADRVWNELGYTGAGVIVGHIDSGVWLTHPDIAGQLWVNPNEIPGNGLDDDGNGFIDDINGWDFGSDDNDPNDDSPSSGHGTHTAGTVVGDGTNGMQTGVAPDARLMALKVWQDNGTGGALSMIWAAQQYCVENGARVITMSLGIEGEIAATYLRNDRHNFNNIRAAGVLMFNSAGNEHALYDPPIECSMSARVPSPWSPTGEMYSHTSGVVSVGGTGYLSDAFYSSSSCGPVTWQTVDPWSDYPFDPGNGLVKPDVAAPAVGVNSTVIPDGYSGNTWSGTSMACPHVAGLAALMLQKNPSLSPTGIDSLMQQNAVDLGTAGKDNYFGSGRIDAYAIVQATPTESLSNLALREIYPDFNGDVVLDPGETAPIAFQLENVSLVENATSVTGSLAVVANSWVTVSDGSAGFPDMAMNGGIANNTGDAFELTIDPLAPQGFDFTLLLTISDGSGFERTFDILWYVGLPDYRTHDVGSAYLTITDQGSIGYLDQPGALGAGFGYLDGESSLYIGSFWAGTDVSYICNRDFSGDGVETFEWENSDDPNGRVRDLGTLRSDQTYSAIFTDSGHASPKPLVVEQNSFAFSGEPDDDFVILEYKLTNEGSENLSTLYTGVFCDFDVADSGANEGGTDPTRNLTYIFSSGGPYYGIALLGETPAHNLTLIENAIYVYPSLHIEDGFKMRHLSGLISLPSSTSATDWSALTSAQVSLDPNGGTATVVYALVYGETLVDLKDNVDAANLAYDPSTPISMESPIKLVRLAQNHPNPFNPATTIKFNVVREGNVDLAVYDLSGRRVKTLVSGTRSEGEHSISWDGTDNSGSRVPSGMFFYRFVSGGETISRKMTLLK
ncbi:MAG: S8 family serine peptidase [Gemmatimonadales bacterium]|nr:S8 family serine peptidase [Gemmatimonadales bacterium]